jgi:hypothetical protein
MLLRRAEQVTLGRVKLVGPDGGEHRAGHADREAGRTAGPIRPTAIPRPPRRRLPHRPGTRPARRPGDTGRGATPAEGPPVTTSSIWFAGVAGGRQARRDDRDRRRSPHRRPDDQPGRIQNVASNRPCSRKTRKSPSPPARDPVRAQRQGSGAARHTDKGTQLSAERGSLRTQIVDLGGSVS